MAPPDLQAPGPTPLTTTGASIIAPLEATPAAPVFLGRRITPLTRRRLDSFRANRRGFWSLWVFLVVFGVTLFAEFVANDRPQLIQYDGAYYMPVFHDYPETTFGGVFPTEADYHDPEVKKLIEAKGWLIWPLIPYHYDTITNAPGPFPAPPSGQDWLGTDDQGRDVLARLFYGFRISVLFGLSLTISSSVIGGAAGAAQGYFGGLIDLGFQRFIEVWSGLPVLYLLIILASLVQPNFWWLLGLMLLFSWTSLVDVVRAEFLRARNFDYVRAARALGIVIGARVQHRAGVGGVCGDGGLQVGAHAVGFPARPEESVGGDGEQTAEDGKTAAQHRHAPETAGGMGVFHEQNDRWGVNGDVDAVIHLPHRQRERAEHGQQPRHVGPRLHQERQHQRHRAAEQRTADTFQAVLPGDGKERLHDQHERDRDPMGVGAVPDQRHRERRRYYRGDARGKAQGGALPAQVGAQRAGDLLAQRHAFVALHGGSGVVLCRIDEFCGQSQALAELERERAQARIERGIGAKGSQRAVETLQPVQPVPFGGAGQDHEQRTQAA